jgi:methionine-rich copper-binding protein CopC
MQLESVRSGTRPSVRARVRRLVDLGIAVALFLVISTSSDTDAAYAHDSVVSSTPSAGATLTTAPGTVTVRFAGRVSRAAVDVRDACGRSVPAEVTTTATEVTATLTPVPMPVPAAATGDRSGQWNVAWQVVGGDGHLVKGQVPFLVRSAPDCGTAAEAAAPGATTEAATTEASGLPMMPIAAAILALLGLLGVALLRRRPAVARS